MSKAILAAFLFFGGAGVTLSMAFMKPTTFEAAPAWLQLYGAFAYFGAPFMMFAALLLMFSLQEKRHNS